MGRGINNLLKFLDSSPSPHPSPVKGEGVFLTFYETINFGDLNFESRQSGTCFGFGVGCFEFRIIYFPSAFSAISAVNVFYFAVTVSGSLRVRISTASSTISSRTWRAGLISLISPETCPARPPT